MQLHRLIALPAKAVAAGSSHPAPPALRPRLSTLASAFPQACKLSLVRFPVPVASLRAIGRRALFLESNMQAMSFVRRR